MENRKGSGEFVKRYGPLLCKTAMGCPRGTPENQNALSDKNFAAYVHYRKCRATNRFPVDDIVSRNAMLIRSVEDSFEQDRESQFQKLIMEVVARR